MAKKVLLIQTAFIGDLILSTALLKHLRRLHPEAELHLFCRRPLGPLMKPLGLVDRVFEWNKRDEKSFHKVKAQLKKESYDIVYCPHPSFRSASLAWSTGAPRRVGFKKWWNSWAFTDRIQRNQSLPEALRQLSLLGIEDQELQTQIGQYLVQQKDRNPNYLDRPGDEDPLASVPEWASLSIRSWFANQGKPRQALLERLGMEAPTDKKPWAAIAPGSIWGTKRYPVEQYHKVAQKLADDGYKVIAVGAPNEVQDCEAVIAGIPSATIVAGATSLLESAHLLYLSDILFTNDCGAMHLASLVDTPTVSMFGPTVLAFGYRPWQNHAVVVQNKELKCRPCHHHGPPTCPLGTHECMKSLLPEKVFSARMNLKTRRR